MNAPIQGTGAEKTVIEGTLTDLRTGNFVSDLTVTAGGEGGIRLYGDESPEIRRCRFSASFSSGVYCRDASPAFTDCTIVVERVEDV